MVCAARYLLSDLKKYQGGEGIDIERIEGVERIGLVGGKIQSNPTAKSALLQLLAQSSNFKKETQNFKGPNSPIPDRVNPTLMAQLQTNSKEPSLLDAPVVVLVAITVAAVVAASSLVPSVTSSQVLLLGGVLGVLFLVVGTFLSSLWTVVLGQHAYVQANNKHVFRPYVQGAFCPRYMNLHPFIIGQLAASSWLILVQPLRHISEYPSFVWAALVISAGTPIYTLGYASYQCPANIVVTWQFHTAIQHLTAAALLHVYMYYY